MINHYIMYIYNIYIWVEYKNYPCVSVSPAFKVARSWVCALEHIGSAAEISRCGVMPCHWCRTTIRTGAVALAARSYAMFAMEDLFLHWELFVYPLVN
jgi:hypothetical protein